MLLPSAQGQAGWSVSSFQLWTLSHLWCHLGDKSPSQLWSPSPPTSRLSNAHLCLKIPLLVCGEGARGQDTTASEAQPNPKAVHFVHVRVQEGAEKHQGRISPRRFPSPGPQTRGPSRSPPAPLGSCAAGRQRPRGSRSGSGMPSGSRRSPSCLWRLRLSCEGCVVRG